MENLVNAGGSSQESSSSFPDCVTQAKTDASRPRKSSKRNQIEVKTVRMKKNIFLNNASDKGLTPRIPKEARKLNSGGVYSLAS